MIKIAILTSSSLGSAAYQLEGLLNSKNIKIEAVVLSRGQIKNKQKHYKRKIKKILNIGLLGAINGIRMRNWYSKGILNYLNITPIEEQCKINNIPLYFTPTINSNKTIEIFKDITPDIAISLGNGYIGSKIFNIPKWGMINIHHEELPAYQNAQSIIWQIFNNSINTGYTIHRINKKIDSGEILYSEQIPILFKNKLSKTISYNYAVLWEKSQQGLVKLLENYEYYLYRSKPQGVGKSYTTPSIFQFVKIVRNHNKMKKKCLSQK